MLYYEYQKSLKLNQMTGLSRWSRPPCLGSSWRPTTWTSRFLVSSIRLIYLHIDSTTRVSWTSAARLLPTRSKVGRLIADQPILKNILKLGNVSPPNILKLGKSVEEIRDTFNFDDLTATLEEEVFVFFFESSEHSIDRYIDSIFLCQV